MGIPKRIFKYPNDFIDNHLVIEDLLDDKDCVSLWHLYNPFKPPEGVEEYDLDAFNFLLSYMSGRTVFTLDMFARAFVDEL
jgi:hypothetical protein